jgi:hypothetical protein
MVVKIVEYPECAIVEFDDGSKVILTETAVVTL